MSIRGPVIAVVAVLLLTGLAFLSSPVDDNEVVRVAFIGNSIMYYNDMPRALETMANGRLYQNSCLHGGADLESHIYFGNGMYEKWMTGQARLFDEEEYWYAEEEAEDDEVQEKKYLYDFGACTPLQLLFGVDPRLPNFNEMQRKRGLEQGNANRQGQDDDAVHNYNDDLVTQEEEKQVQNWYEKLDTDFLEGFDLLNDGKNPCVMDPNYYTYLQQQYGRDGPPEWDYIVINDRSRSPCCTEQRGTGLQYLETFYAPLINLTSAVPIFLVTYPYWAPDRDMSGLTDIPTFASLTYEGYREYAEVLGGLLPESQKPRLADVNLAFLLVWEENPKMFADLIHYDGIHPSPSGSFLEACVLFATIFGRLPDRDLILKDPANLFRYARRMTPVQHQQKPFPTTEVAQYLSHIAYRVAIRGETPRSLIRYYHNESADFIPDDSIYSKDPNAAPDNSRNRFL